MLCLIAESIEGCVLTCCLRLLYCCIYPVNKIDMNCKIQTKKIKGVNKQLPQTNNKMFLYLSLVAPTSVL